MKKENNLMTSLNPISTVNTLITEIAEYNRHIETIQLEKVKVKAQEMVYHHQIDAQFHLQKEKIEKDHEKWCHTVEIAARNRDDSSEMRKIIQNSMSEICKQIANDADPQKRAMLQELLQQQEKMWNQCGQEMHGCLNDMSATQSYKLTQK